MEEKYLTNQTEELAKTYFSLEINKVSKEPCQGGCHKDPEPKLEEAQLSPIKLEQNTSDCFFLKLPFISHKPGSWQVQDHRSLKLSLLVMLRSLLTRWH